MTGYTVHTGTSVKFSTGWDRVFENKKDGPAKSPASPSKSEVAAAGSVKKAAAKKSVAKPVKSAAKAAVKKTVKPPKKKSAAKSVKRGK